jgi:hypothetical protein
MMNDASERKKPPPHRAGSRLRLEPNILDEKLHLTGECQERFPRGGCWTGILGVAGVFAPIQRDASLRAAEGERGP